MQPCSSSHSNDQYMADQADLLASGPGSSWPTRHPIQHDDFCTIGELSREFGITLRALRFYQSKGLLAPRRNGKARLYSGLDRERVGLILQGIRLGFTLAEIRDVIGTCARRGGKNLPVSRQKCVEQINLLERQRRDLDDAIAELRRIYTAMFTPTDTPPAPRQAAARAS